MSDYKLALNSKRKYSLSYFQYGSFLTIESISLSDIVHNEGHYEDTELLFSCNEIVDELIDLSVNECMHFSGSRDDRANTKGIIARIN